MFSRSERGVWCWVRINWDIVGTRISFLVDNEWKVRFWKDRWCGDSCVSFPSLFALAINKEV